MTVRTTPSIQPAGPTEPPGNGPFPPLENGDRLTRDEFERRYDAMPDLTNADVIEVRESRTTAIPGRRASV